MADASGWNTPPQAKDPPSASPFLPAPDTRPGKNAETAVDAPTVLLVEDNATDVFVIRELLNNSGLNFRLHVAGNGEDALHYLRSRGGEGRLSCPILVLLDLNLPRIAGLDVLRELRSGEQCTRTPVIIITSSMAETDRLTAMRLGANAYFTKPGDLTAYMELVALVKDVLG